MDTVIDIASEVVLSIQLDGNYYDGMVFILLSTTSGSLYRIDLQEKERDVRISSMGSIVARGIASRLSSMLWGGQTTNNGHINNRILRIIVLNRPMDDMDDMDDDSEEATILLGISTSTISLYSPFDKTLLWSVSLSQMVESQLSLKLRVAGIRPSDPLHLWCLDVQPMRQGALFLFGVSTANGGVELGLAYLDLRNNITSSPASFNCIFMLSNKPTLGIFRADDESSFVDRVHLLIALNTATADTMAHTDGVSILHLRCVQTVFLSESFHDRATLRLSRTIELPTNDTLLGYACGNDYSYIIRARSGVETIRILPIGFEHDSEESVKELEEVLEEKDGDLQLIALFKKSLLYFITKRISQASAMLNTLLKVENADLPTIIYMFLLEMIDNPCSSSGITADLRNKRLIFQRLILYLKNMQVYDQIMDSQKSVVPPFKDSVEIQLMSSLMQEIGERLDVALVLSACAHKTEVRLLEDAAEIAAKEYGVNEGGYQNVFLSEVSSVHVAFPSLMACLRAHLHQSSPEHRLDALAAAARILLAMSGAIEKNRASHTSIAVPQKAVQWTNGVIAQAYLDLAECIVEEMEKDNGTLSDTTRIRLKQLMTGALCFGLSENRGRAEKNKLLARIYEMGEADLALDMAEKFKDFRLLMKITTSMDESDRATLLEGYKRRFADDNFELYMCNYFLKHNMTECLLSQRGQRVEEFMEEHEGIRWRRQLQTEKYDKAASSLMAAAAHDHNSLWEKKMYASLAFLSACCADEDTFEAMGRVMRAADETLTLISHQERIPLETLEMLYPGQRQRPLPLSVDEMIEVNMYDCEDPNDLVEGLCRALALIGELMGRETSLEAMEELDERLANVWKRTFDAEFYQIQSIEEANRTLFVTVLTKVMTNDDITSKTKLIVLPSRQLLPELASEICAEVVKKSLERAELMLTV